MDERAMYANLVVQLVACGHSVVSACTEANTAIAAWREAFAPVFPGVRIAPKWETIASASNGKELPRYQCHKIVGAFRISTINAISAPPVLIEGEGYVREVSYAWRDKHKPQLFGYFVEYDDGYQSFSPAEAFEAGYTRIG